MHVHMGMVSFSCFWTCMFACMEVYGLCVLLELSLQWQNSQTMHFHACKLLVICGSIWLVHAIKLSSQEAGHTNHILPACMCSNTTLTEINCMSVGACMCEYHGRWLDHWPCAVGDSPWLRTVITSYSIILKECKCWCVRVCVISIANAVTVKNGAKLLLQAATSHLENAGKNFWQTVECALCLVFAVGHGREDCLLNGVFANL